jgi:hypothetical protein
MRVQDDARQAMAAMGGFIGGISEMPTVIKRNEACRDHYHSMVAKGKRVHKAVSVYLRDYGEAIMERTSLWHRMGSAAAVVLISMGLLGISDDAFRRQPRRRVGQLKIEVAA